MKKLYIGKKEVQVNPMRFKYSYAIAVLAIACMVGFAATNSQAEAFNEALTFSYNPDATGVNSSGLTDYYDVISNVSAATTSYTKSGDWGSVYGYASADLATGQLKMQSSATSLTDQHPYMQANAIFGDSFTTTTTGGTPFVWSSSTTATFEMALSGAFTLDGSDNLSNAGAFVILIIDQKGTMTDPQNLIGSNTIAYFLWDMGNPTETIYYTGTDGISQKLDITAGYSYIPSTLRATFVPGGDFDWALLLGASGQVSPGDSFDADLADTLTLNYVAPAGGVTTSDSGLFTNISSASNSEVPEPTSLLLLSSGLGMIGLAAWRRKK
jgi:hypothetical protein